MSTLLTRQAWHDQQVLTYFSTQLATLFSGVHPRQQRRLLQLSRDSSTAQTRLAEQLRRLHQQTETIAVDLLALELRKVAGYPIDPRTALLHARQRRSPRAAAQGHESQPLLSRTLWQAALDSFGFDISHGTGSGLDVTDHSYLTDAHGAELKGIEVTDFVRIVRELDLGEQIARTTGAQLQTRIAAVLRDHCEAQVKFDLLHGHCLNPSLVSVEELDNLSSSLADPEQHWMLQHLKAGSQTFDIPFFVRDLKLQDGDPVYCYFPDRPGGAWRRHPSLQSATDSLLQQIRDSAKSGRLDWLLRQLSLNSQQRLSTYLQAPRQSLDDFNWLAKRLYALFGDERSPSERLAIGEQNLEVKSLLQAVQDQQALRFYSDITRLATSTAAADRRTLARGLEYVVSETLEMILLPLPGGLLGAGKLVMVAMLGSLAYQTASALQARQDGESAQFVQALSDIFDLLISARLQGVGARLSAQRSRQLMAQLRNPRIVDKVGRPKAIDWSTPLDAPPFEHPGTNAISLLRKMLPAESATLADSVLERCLTLAALSTTGLEAIWSAMATTPRELSDLLMGEQLRSEFDALTRALDTDSELPPLANEVLPTLLARLLNVRVWIFEQHSQRYSGQYASDQPSTSAPRELFFTHTGHRRYHGGVADSAASSLPLFEAVIREYDRLEPDNIVGKQGDFTVDAQPVQRASVLRRQLSERFKQDWHGLFQQWLLKRLGQPPSPDMTGSAPPLARHRAISAIATVADSHGRGAPQDAFHLMLAILPTLPGWPAELGINLYEGYLDRNGQLRRGAHLIHRYGESDASTFIGFVQLGTRLAGIDQHSADMIQVRSIEYPVNDLVLRTLLDSQRDAIDHGLHDAAKLGQTVIDLALAERADLLPLFPEPRWISLGAARLAPFLCNVKPSQGPPDGQGLYAAAGRIYARIDNAYYQVLHDLEASSPSLPIMRIVRAGDEVATAPDNRYIGSRLGSSEPIARNGSGEWQGILVGLAGGQPPKRYGQRVPHGTRLTRRQADDNLQAATAALLAAEQAMQPAVEAMRQADLVFQRAEDADRSGSTPQTQAALLAATRARVPLMPPLLLKRTQVLDSQNAKAKVLDDYLGTVLPGDQTTRNLHKGEYQGLCLQRIMSIDQVILLNILMATAVTERLRDDPALHPEEFIKHREIHLQMLEKNRHLALQREADIQALRGPWATADVEARLAQAQPENPLSSYYVRVAQLQFHGDILSVDTGSGPSRFDFRVADLTTQFRENAIALGTVDDIIPEQHIALLDGIEREFENLHQAMLQLSNDYAPGPRRVRAERMVEIAREFELMSHAQLKAALGAQHDPAASERLSDDLDLDFLPARPGPRPQPAKPRKRVIHIRRRGVDSIAVGEIRDAGEHRTVAVVSPESGGVVRTYRQNAAGTWQPATASASPVAIATQQNLAAVRLSLVARRLEEARQMHARRENPTNTVEMLERHADALLELAPALPTLADELRQAAATLSELGRALMIERYKDPAILDVHRLRFLMAANEVEVSRTTRRLARGKGRHRYYLDVYEVRDAQSTAALWHAHFHYPAVDTADDGYPLRGGHLKTLEQSRLGREHQAQQEQAGLPVERIWRQEIDRDTARKLFAKAAPGE